MNTSLKQVFSYITSDSGLKEICDNWNLSRPLALDTEFVRTNTFFPKVGLLQVADPESVYLLDPLAIRSWDEFRTLLGNAQLTVILHSCSEDLNLLQHFLGCLPARLFDTQRAAAYLGHGLSISYQALLAAELNIVIGKGETRSDWIARPLSASQLEYAALDVAYLHQLHDRLRSRLESQGRLPWFEEDCRNLLAIAQKDEADEEWERYYQHINGAWRLNKEELAILQKLCFWREQTARERNRPRSWVLKDADLLNLAVAALRQPVSLEIIASVTLLKSPYLERDGNSLIEFLGSDYTPEVVADPSEFPRPLSPAQRNVLKQLQQAVAEIAREIGIAPELLAKKRQLLELLERLGKGGDDPWPADMTTWRKDILAAHFNRILQLD